MTAIPGEIKTKQDTSEAQVQTRVAWYYYVGGLTQQEIADRLSLTRDRVNRIVGQARADGLVRIEVRLPLANCVALEERLKARYELDEVTVVLSTSDPAVQQQVIGEVAGIMLDSLLWDDNRLGVGWGSTRSLALQSRQIIDHLNAYGYAIDRVMLSGGHLENPLMVRLYHDALGTGAIVSDTPEPMLLGTAMVASVLAGLYLDLFAALEAMAPAQRPLPKDRGWAHAHDAAYRIYLKLFATCNEIDAEARAWLAAPATMA